MRWRKAKPGRSLGEALALSLVADRDRTIAVLLDGLTRAVQHVEAAAARVGSIESEDR